MEPIQGSIQPISLPSSSTHFQLLKEIGWKGEEANAKQFYEAIEKIVSENFLLFTSDDIFENDPIVLIKNFQSSERSAKIQNLTEKKELLIPSFATVLEYNQVWIFEIYGLIFGFDNLHRSGCITITDLAKESRFLMMDILNKYGFNFVEDVKDSVIIQRLRELHPTKKRVFIKGLIGRGIRLDVRAIEEEEPPSKRRLHAKKAHKLVPLLLQAGVENVDAVIPVDNTRIIADLRALGWKGNDCDYITVLTQLREDLEAMSIQFPKYYTIIKGSAAGINVIASAKYTRAESGNQTVAMKFFGPRLYEYIESNHLNGMISILLLIGNKLPFKISPLECAVQHLKPDVIRLLLQYEMKFNDQILNHLPEKVLTEEEENQFLAILQIIQTETHNPNFYKDFQQILLVKSIYNFNICLHLLQQGVNVTQALKVAITTNFPGRLATVGYLLGIGADPNLLVPDRSCLELAMDSNSFEADVAGAIVHYSDINKVDAEGKTLLIRKVQSLNEDNLDEAFEVLLKSPRIELEIFDRSGNTALRHACMIPDKAVRHAAVKRLLKAGANPNTLPETGITLSNFLANQKPFDEVLFRLLIETA